MFLTQTGVAGLLVLGLASAAQASASARSATADLGEGGQQAEVDVSRLPLDLQRIYRGLQQSTIRVERDGLNLRYVIEVFGQAPRLVVFTKEDNLVNGPVPYGAPTHKEILEHITPREYRAPAADIGALIRWLAERARK